MRYNGDMTEVQAEIDNFVEQLVKDFPDLHFRLGKKFTFRPPRTIIYELQPKQRAEKACIKSDDSADDKFGIATRNEQNYYRLQLLHEVGHAVLEHKNFATDLERLQMERAAWEEAKKMCTYYGVEYDEEFVEEELDTYRDWLHQKSCCPVCKLTRYQTRDGKYHCPSCESML